MGERRWNKSCSNSSSPPSSGSTTTPLQTRPFNLFDVLRNAEYEIADWMRALEDRLHAERWKLGCFDVLPTERRNTGG